MLVYSPETAAFYRVAVKTSTISSAKEENQWVLVGALSNSCSRSASTKALRQRQKT